MVIKVQHDGIEARMASDVRILAQMLKLMRKLEPDFDLTPIARQWMAAIPEELVATPALVSPGSVELNGCFGLCVFHLAGFQA